jgi:hypothetical protein
MTTGKCTSWADVVFLDLIGVEGLTLTQALYKYADANDLHDDLDGVCHCVICQTLAPMAGKLEADPDEDTAWDGYTEDMGPEEVVWDAPVSDESTAHSHDTEAELYDILLRTHELRDGTA